ncbi:MULTISPECIES: fumarate reductase [unclassified Porphyromonas]|uniref:fumarate reductase n=1 Tax=unclassified Porphyromonas TaxID=2645799 RepID=UPI00052D1768|nr:MULTISPECIES: fumarate reductase [unclassified Porphyromonas]KGN83636.1 fumarate reductase [Porphyromonas sp. COT-290 OH860]KGO01491.1 fumarate reductase [Porphyromonas sp. COT-290 OH3588]
MSWLIKSSIGRKLVMSISGLALILFLTFHMSMNLVALFSEEGYNMICEFLGANWYALVATKALALLFLVHIIYALILTMQNRKARGNSAYGVVDKPKGVEWASQNMMVLGVIVLLGLGLHMFNFWAKMQLAELQHIHDLGIPGVNGPTDGAGLIRYTFSNPVYVLLYLVWLAALWFHLAHGFWSSLHTIGWNNNTWLKRLETISNIYATVLVLGFALVVVYFFLQSLCAGSMSCPFA